MKDTCKQTSQHRRAPRVELICTGRDQSKSRIRIFQQEGGFVGQKDHKIQLITLFHHKREGLSLTLTSQAQTYNPKCKPGYPTKIYDLVWMVEPTVYTTQ